MRKWYRNGTAGIAMLDTETRTLIRYGDGTQASELISRGISDSAYQSWRDHDDDPGRGPGDTHPIDPPPWAEEWKIQVFMGYVDRIDRIDRNDINAAPAGKQASTKGREVT